MTELVVISWRDIPAQIVARAGRQTAKRELPPRFAAAIDAAAMRGGARDEDAYLAGWRRGAPEPADGTPDEAVAAALARIEADYPPERLARLVALGGAAP